MTEPVSGDGSVTISCPQEINSNKGEHMDPDFSKLMMAETAANMQASNNTSRRTFDAVMAAIAGTVQTNFAEIGLLEGRTASGVLATPIASPTKTA